MKILIISPRFPFPIHKADRLTVNRLIQHLSRRHEIDLIAFGEKNFGDDFKEEYVKEIQSYCNEIHVVKLDKHITYLQSIKSIFDSKPLQIWYFYRKAMMEKVKQVTAKNNYDIIYAHLIRTAEFAKNIYAPVKILAMQISLTLEYRRLVQYSEFISNPLKKVLYSIEYRKLCKYEPAIAKHFDKVLLISDKDKEEIKKHDNINNVFFNPHGVDYEKFHPSTTREKIPNSLAFIGSMSNDPNVDAVLYFYYNIFPYILKEIPDAQFYIVGINPPSSVRKLGEHPNVTVTNYVENIRDYLGRVNVAIDPLRIGAGFQNKILEALSMEIPMVVTPTANEGTKALNGKHLLVASNEKDFANKVISLMKNKKLGRKLGKEGRKFVINNFSWEQHFNDLEEIMLELFKKKRTKYSKTS